MLQLHSNKVEQHFTLHCNNTIAWSDERQQLKKSITLIGANEYAFGSKSPERPIVLRDDCKVSIGQLYILFILTTKSEGEGGEEGGSDM